MAAHEVPNFIGRHRPTLKEPTEEVHIWIVDIFGGRAEACCAIENVQDGLERWCGVGVELE